MSVYKYTHMIGQAHWVRSLFQITFIPIPDIAISVIQVEVL